jgi:hypothetical protein
MRPVEGPAFLKTAGTGADFRCLQHRHIAGWADVERRQDIRREGAGIDGNPVREDLDAFACGNRVPMDDDLAE